MRPDWFLPCPWCHRILPDGSLLQDSSNCSVCTHRGYVSRSLMADLMVEFEQRYLFTPVTYLEARRSVH